MLFAWMLYLVTWGYAELEREREREDRGGGEEEERENKRETERRQKEGRRKKIWGGISWYNLFPFIERT